MPTDIAIAVAAIAAAFLVFTISLGWAERRTRGISPHFYPPTDDPQPYERSSPDTGKSAAGNSAA
jgi:hypothetical protein